MIKHKKSNPKKQDKKEELDNFSDSILLVQETPEKEESRIIGLFGDVAEETCAEVITNLLILSNRGEIPKNERKDKYSHPPIEFYVNTHGGSASDMFAIYDMMRQIRKKCEKNTELCTFA